jgi:peptide/nickel transport system substrate-binding protein
VRELAGEQDPVCARNDRTSTLARYQKRLIALLAAACAALAITACGGGEGSGGNARQGGSVTIAATSNPDYLDPALAYTVEAAIAHWLIYPGLLTYKHEEGKAGTELIPAAADAMPKVSSDGKTYGFTLRKGLKYSDGTPVKASDFEHAIQRALTLGWGGSSFFQAIDGVTEYLEGKKKDTDIEGIESDDRAGRITIRLTERNGQFSYILAFPSAGLVPGDTPFENESKDPPPGLGAYKFDNATIEPNRQFTLVKNRRFSIPDIPSGNLDRIDVKLIKNQARLTQDVIKGKLDWMFNEPSTDLLPEVRAKYKDRYEENVANQTYFMFLNPNKPPFDKLAVRQAVNYAFDKRAAVRLFSGLLEPDCNYLPPSMIGYEKIDPCPWGDPTKPPDIEKARQLVERSGMKGARVGVWGNDEERTTRIVEYYTDVLNKIGLKAKPKIVGATTYYPLIGSTKVDPQTGFASWFQDFPHPADFFFSFTTSALQPTNSPNYGRVSDLEIDSLADEIEGRPADEIADKAKELDKLLTGPDKAYLLAFGHSLQTTFVSERMDFENCTVFHPVYQDDWSQFCLK